MKNYIFNNDVINCWLPISKSNGMKQRTKRINCHFDGSMSGKFEKMQILQDD